MRFITQCLNHHASQQKSYCSQSSIQLRLYRPVFGRTTSLSCITSLIVLKDVVYHYSWTAWVSQCPEKYFFFFWFPWIIWEYRSINASKPVKHEPQGKCWSFSDTYKAECTLAGMSHSALPFPCFLQLYYFTAACRPSCSGKFIPSYFC